MKKILMVAITLIASVSVFAQDNGTSAEWGYKPSNVVNVSNSSIKSDEKITTGEFIILKSGRILTETEKFYGKITVSDSTVKFEQLGSTDIFKINKKYSVNGNVIYNVIDTKNPDSKVEFFLNKENNYFEYSVAIERISGTKIVDSKLYFFESVKKNKVEEEKNTKSFGCMGGYSTFLGKASAASVSYGTYIDFGYFGLEYYGSAAINTDLNSANNYINGTTEKFVGGSSTMNIGAFFKFDPKKPTSMTMGLGVQKYEEYSAQNKVIGSTYNPLTKQTTNISGPVTSTDNKTLPYFTVGVISKLSNDFTFRASVLLSNCSMINVGVGFNF